MPLIFIFPSVCVFISAPDVYAVIRCEEDSVRTKIFKNNGSPEFNTKAIFYNRNPKSKISIEVRGYCTVFCEGWLLALFLFYKWINKKRLCWCLYFYLYLCLCSCGKEVCCWTHYWEEHKFRQEDMSAVKTEWLICRVANREAVFS